MKKLLCILIAVCVTMGTFSNACAGSFDLLTVSDFTSLPASGEVMSDISEDVFSYRSSNGEGRYKIADNSVLGTGFSGKSLYISPLASAMNSGGKAGVTKVLAEPAVSGNVRVESEFFVGKNDNSSTPKTTTGLWGETRILNENNDTLARLFLNSNKQLSLYIGDEAQQLTDISISAGTFVRWETMLHLDAGKIELRILWQNPAKTSADSLHNIGLNGIYSLIYDDKGNAVLKTDVPATLEFGSVNAVRFFVYANSATQLRQNYLNCLEIYPTVESILAYLEYMPDDEYVSEILNERSGIHPRILNTAQQWSQLTEAIDTSTTVYSDAIGYIDKLYSNTLLTEEEAADIATQSTHRKIASQIEAMTYGYILTGEQKYFTKAVEWAELAVGITTTYGTNDLDLANGQMMYSFAMLYDYCHDILDAELKSDLLNAMYEHADVIYEAISNPEKAPNAASWCRNQYLGNYGMVIVTGLAYAAYAIYDELDTAEKNEKVRKWITASQRWFAHTYALSGDDGMSIEGIHYYTFGISYLNKAAELSRTMWGLDPYEKSLWLKNSVLYRLYMSYPKNTWSDENTVAQFGDGYGEDCSPVELLLYKSYQYSADKDLLVLASDMRSQGANVSRDMYAPLYYDKSSMSDLPENIEADTLAWFKDGGVVSTRTDWSGSENALYFKCGPNIGTKASEYIDLLPVATLGEAHSHPDTNHFILCGNGEVLLRDDGYAYKKTSQHNTLLINGVGQLGENGEWYNAGDNRRSAAEWSDVPYITGVKSSDSYDYFVGVGADAYPESANLTRYNRHMLFIKPNILIVLDDIELSENSDIELRFFPESQNITEIENGYAAVGDSSKLIIQNLTSDASTLEVNDFDVYTGRELSSLANRRGFLITKTDKTLINATVLSWGDADYTGEQITMNYYGGRAYFHTENSGSFYVDMSDFEAGIADNVVLENITENMSEDTLTISADMVNCSESDYDCVLLIAAQYNHDKTKLKSICSQRIQNLMSKTTAGINATLKLKDYTSTDTVRYFIWDSFENMIPLD